MAALLVVAALGASGCGSEGNAVDATALDDDAITVASFNFTESRVLAAVYGGALERGGYQVRYQLAAGPRELVHPALAQDVNTFVVRRDVAERFGLRDLSDLRAVAPRLRFGGPPECPERPLCLAGLCRTYDLRFGQVLSLDAGGPLTHQALDDGFVGVALLRSTDAASGGGDVVALRDDRALVVWTVVALNVFAVMDLADRTDSAFLRVLAGLRTPWLSSTMRAIDRLFTDWGATALAFGLLVALVVLRRWRHLLTGIGSLFVLEVVGSTLYADAARPRPYDVTIIGRWAGAPS